MARSFYLESKTKHEEFSKFAEAWNGELKENFSVFMKKFCDSNHISKELEGLVADDFERNNRYFPVFEDYYTIRLGQYTNMDRFLFDDGIVFEGENINGSKDLKSFLKVHPDCVICDEDGVEFSYKEFSKEVSLGKKDFFWRDVV